MSAEGQPTVSYQVKDLLDNLGKQIERGFDDVKYRMDKQDMRLEAKASNERVAGVEKSLADLEQRHGARISALELRERGTAAVSALQGKWAAAAFTFLTAIVAALIYLAAGGVH